MRLMRHYGSLAAITRANRITRVRVLLRFAYESGLIEQPIRFGEFRKPRARTLREERTPKEFTKEQIRALLDHATPMWRAMILMGLNGGFGNGDCCALPWTAIEYPTQEGHLTWIDFPRPKTGAPRRFPLWPETIAALEALPHVGPYVFTPQRGNQWSESDRTMSKQFRSLAKRAGIHQHGLGFYTLRHVFATVASDKCRDSQAIASILGHVGTSMAEKHYIEGISARRLFRVVAKVRIWLFAVEKATT
jgi:integrase